MEEVWRGITSFACYDGRCKYEVSNLGGVRQAEYVDAVGVVHAAELVHTYLHGQYKYKIVCLVDDMNRLVRRGFSVHRLVALAFVPQPEGCKYVTWIDGDNLNNVYTNLKWVRGFKDNSGLRRNAGRKIRVYLPSGEFLWEFDMIQTAVKRLGVVASPISKCCRRKTSSYLGLVWRYTTDDEFYTEGAIGDLKRLEKLCKYRESGSMRGAIRQYSLDGKLVREFKSVAEIERWRSAWTTSIADCCNRVIREAYDSIWRYAYDDELYDLSESERAEAVKLLHTYKNSRVVRQYSLSGVLVAEHPSVSDAQAASKVKRGSSTVSACCNRVIKTSAGFIWRYAEDDELFELSEADRAVVIAGIRAFGGKVVRQYTLDGNFVAEYRSVAEAMRAVKSKSCKIYNCCLRQPNYNTSVGFIWRYADDDEFRGK